MIDRDDYGEPIPVEVCVSCRRGWHHECWGCGCPCNRDDDEPAAVEHEERSAA